MKIIEKIKGGFAAAKKWFYIFVLEYKIEALVVSIGLFGLFMDMMAGTRFNSFFAFALVGSLIWNVVKAKKQADLIKALSTKKKK